MNTEEKMRCLLEWLLQELQGELARIQKEKETQEEFLLNLMDEIHWILD